MKLRSLAVAAALVASSSTFAATCTSSFNLGSMGPPATKSFDKSYTGLALFSDCYDFSINAAANATGTTTESKFVFLTRFIDVLTVSLFDGITGAKVGNTDTSPNVFSFSNLAAGGYKLVVGGYAVGSGASYAGTLTTSQAAVASPVPEAPLSGMLALAMVGAALVARRAKRG